jgi:hypothetical protein
MGRSKSRRGARMIERKRKHRMKAEPVGLVDPAPHPSREFAATDDERLITRVHLRTQKALTGEITPRGAYLCLFGTAMICADAGVGEETAVEAFVAEYRRVASDRDRWRIEDTERLRAEVGLGRESKP